MTTKRFIHSLRDAWRGITYVARNEQNFRIQLVAGAVAIAASFLLPLRSWEVVVVVLLVALVFVMELLNTALEWVNDLLKPRLHHHVFVIKDIMAGAVLITSLTALIIGFIIFLPHFLTLAK